jgi:hypothetical protein
MAGCLDGLQLLLSKGDMVPMTQELVRQTTTFLQIKKKKNCREAWYRYQYGTGTEIVIQCGLVPMTQELIRHINRYLSTNNKIIEENLLSVPVLISLNPNDPKMITVNVIKQRISQTNTFLYRYAKN